MALRIGDGLLVARAEFWVGRALFEAGEFGEAGGRVAVVGRG